MCVCGEGDGPWCRAHAWTGTCTASLCAHSRTLRQKPSAFGFTFARAGRLNPCAPLLRCSHNEIDEPMFTQPIMYQAIKRHRNALQVYQDHLLKEGSVSKEQVGVVWLGGCGEEMQGLWADVKVDVHRCPFLANECACMRVPVVSLCAGAR